MKRVIVRLAGWIGLVFCLLASLPVPRGGD